MFPRKYMAAAVVAAIALTGAFFLPGPAAADAPEITMDTFAPGSPESSLTKLGLKGTPGKMQGNVAWDGYELTAEVHGQDGVIGSTDLKGAMDNGLIGMFVGLMGEKNMLAALMDCDGAKTSLMRKASDGMSDEACAEFILEAMGKWADEGKKNLMLTYLPETMFRASAAALKAGTPLDAAMLTPFEKETVYTLLLERSGDTLSFRIDTVKGISKTLLEWKE